MINERYKLKGLIGVLVLAWMSSAILAETIIYVDPLAPGANDGSNWTDAYICLQNALESAQAGDEIRVAQGIYKPDQRTTAQRTGSNREIFASGDNDETFSLPEGVAVMGGYAGYTHTDPNTRDIDTYPSILSGDLYGNDIDLIDLQWRSLSDFIAAPTLRENSRTVVTATNASDQTVLDGFTITAGRCAGGSLAPTRSRGGTTLPNPAPATEGAGVLVDAGSPLFIRCTFYRNTVQSSFDLSTGGAGVASDRADPTFRACIFEENIAFGDGGSCYGAAVLDYEGAAQLIDCTFRNNVTAGSDSCYCGGAVANIRSDCNMTACSFVGNQAIGSAGGAVFNWSYGTIALTDCTFERNRADLGGAVCNQEDCTPALTGCLFLANEATDAARDGVVYTPTEEVIVSGQGGAVYNGEQCTLSVTSCRFLGNTAAGQGGAVCAVGSPRIVNSVFSGNGAARGGAICLETNGLTYVTNSTFASNQASEDGGAFYDLEGMARFYNCILWEDMPQEIYPLAEDATVFSSDVQGYASGEHGSFDADPRFQDATGADGVAGTLDDNLRLSVGSPCLDSGDDSALPLSLMTDLDGLARVTNIQVDIGAYEFHGPYSYYVDAVQGNDSYGGYSPRQAFATIQKGIDVASTGYTVMVLPGIYTEEINFDGRAITVAGSNGGAILEAPGGYGVSFYTAERSTSVLKNFVIRNCDVGIFIAGASPTIQNTTLAHNEFGIAAYAGADPDISNCILWNNIDGDLFGCTATFSCVEQGIEDLGNIRQDPLFGDADNGDFHLLSERGRFVSAYGLWSFDMTTSPCVDAGDPLLDPGAERMPNGGRINMGAFGGTPQASMSEWPLVGDINRDGIVDEADLAILEAQWLEELPIAGGAGSADTDPPQPNPARWDIDGLPQEFRSTRGEVGYMVEMTAAEAVDPSGPVEYFFECQQAEFSSGWQMERRYVVSVRRPGQDLQFRVRTRDPFGNMTDWSEWAVAQ